MKKRAYIIHKGELCAYNYRSSYIIAKVDLIDYLLNHSDDPPVHPTGKKPLSVCPISMPHPTIADAITEAKDRKVGGKMSPKMER